MTQSLQQSIEETHVVGYATFIKVWLALVVLTGILVALSASHRPNLTLVGLLLVTPTKASLVLYYFMHLKYEKAGLKYMVTATVAVLVVFIFLTFSDYLYR
jgi:cytochrome c oxidase subunit IV